MDKIRYVYIYDGEEFQHYTNVGNGIKLFKSKLDDATILLVDHKDSILTKITSNDNACSSYLDVDEFSRGKAVLKKEHMYNSNSWVKDKKLINGYQTYINANGESMIICDDRNDVIYMMRGNKLTTDIVFYDNNDKK